MAGADHLHLSRKSTSAMGLHINIRKVICYCKLPLTQTVNEHSAIDKDMKMDTMPWEVSLYTLSTTLFYSEDRAKD